MSDLIFKGAAVGEFITLLTALLPDVTASKIVMIASGLVTLNYTFAAIDLAKASRGKGGTLSCVYGVMSVKVW